MSEFKKWWYKWSGSDKLPENTDIRYAFEAGQQYQQAKIDELQARLDEALKSIMICEEYDHAEKLDEIYNILKGNKDE